MTVVFFLMSSYVAMALDPVMYLDKDGKEQWCTDYKVITGYEKILTRGWYVVKGDVVTNYELLSRKMGIEVRGNVHIILTDNCLFDYDNWWGFVDSSNENAFEYFSTLNIYSQSFGENMGKMKMKLANRYAFSIYNLNIYGGNFEINDNGGGGFAFHCQSFSCWNGNIAVGNKECMDVDILKLYGGQLHCEGGLRIHSKVVFGQSVTDIVCDFSRCDGINEVFVFLGKTKDVIIEEGVTVRVGEESYTERIPEDVLTGGVFDPMRTGTLSLTSTTDDEVLSVDDISCTEPRNSGWYTLNGIRLDGKPTSAGIYIHDGRKVIVK